jgi:hypothetical protein
MKSVRFILILTFQHVKARTNVAVSYSTAAHTVVCRQHSCTQCGVLTVDTRLDLRYSTVSTHTAVCWQHSCTHNAVCWLLTLDWISIDLTELHLIMFKSLWHSILTRVRTFTCYNIVTQRYSMYSYLTTSEYRRRLKLLTRRTVRRRL